MEEVAQEDLTVTMSIPVETVIGNSCSNAQGHLGDRKTDQCLYCGTRMPSGFPYKDDNPQPTPEATPQELSTNNPQETIEKIQCNIANCRHKIFNTKEEFDQHVKDIHTAGRPCEYCIRAKEINAIAIKYLTQARDAKKSGKPFIPYLQELADLLECDSDRISLWANKTKDDGKLEHPEFYGIVKSLNNLKELLLLKRTTGRFNPTGAIFQLKTKHGYIETEKQILAGDKTAEPIQITIVEEKKTYENA